MLRKVFYLTTEFDNCGTETELFATNEALESHIEQLIRTTIEDLKEFYVPEMDWQKARMDNAEKCLAFLDAREFELAFELYIDGSKGDGSDAVKGQDDCIWRGEQELDFPDEVTATQPEIERPLAK